MKRSRQTRLGLADRSQNAALEKSEHRNKVDRGGTVAWWLASCWPERLVRMVIANAPHPVVWCAAMEDDSEQRRKSRYARLLRIPLLPEILIRLGGYRGLEKVLADNQGSEAFDSDTMDRYRAAWGQRGALRAMLNWYRALFRQDLKMPLPSGIVVPTLLVWGDRNRFAVPRLSERSAALCADVCVEHWPDATHWTPHDDPQRFARAVSSFLIP